MGDRTHHIQGIVDCDAPAGRRRACVLAPNTALLAVGCRPGSESGFYRGLAPHAVMAVVAVGRSRVRRAAFRTGWIDSVHGFSLQVSPRWHIAPAGYELMDVEIYAAANNLDPAFVLPVQRRAARAPLEGEGAPSRNGPSSAFHAPVAGD
jgi:hypothetical protein